MKPVLFITSLLMIVAARAGAVTAPVATYESVQDLKGYYPLAFEPWSPNGHLLGMIGSQGGLFVWDANQPEKSPRMVARVANELAQWSPDGGWLVYDGIDRRGSLCLLTVRVSDASRDTFPLPRVRPYLWASDGRIYGWTASDVAISEISDHWHSRRVVAGPPKLWSSDHPGAHPGQATLVPGPFGFLAGPAPKEWDLAINHEPEMKYVLLESTFPGDSLFLVMAGGTRAESSRNCVIDLRGRVVRVLEDPNQAVVGGCLERADWNSVSADGKYLIGAREVKHKALVNGHPHSTVYLGDPRGKWSTPVKDAPDGAGPRWSPGGYQYCAMDYPNGVLHVGRIRVEPARPAK